MIDQKNHLFKDRIKNPVFGDYCDTAFSIFFDIFFYAVLRAAIAQVKQNLKTQFP